MIKLKLFTEGAVRTLKKKIGENQGGYETAQDCLFVKGLPTVPSRIQLPDAPPTLSGGNKKDAENARKLFEYLPNLTRSQARDERLWVTLAHTTFWPYMQVRWPTPKHKVKDLWFYGPKAPTLRQGLARLWWSAYLTRAPWTKDDDLKQYRDVDEWKYLNILFRNQTARQQL